MPFWLLNNKLVTDSLGRPINCPTCPCVGATAVPDCLQCDTGTAPATIKIQFTVDLNQSGACGTCGAAAPTGWIGTWTFSRMTVQAVDAIWLAYPTTFFNFNAPRDQNCWYICTAPSLPCTAQFATAEIYGNSPNQLNLIVGYTAGNWVGLQMHFSTSLTSCIAAFKNAGAPSIGSGYSNAGTTPCDFLKFFPGGAGLYNTVFVTASQ